MMAVEKKSNHPPVALKLDKIENFPGYSTDLNPIEHIWGDIKRHLKPNPAKNKEDL